MVTAQTVAKVIELTDGENSFEVFQVEFRNREYLKNIHCNYKVDITFEQLFAVLVFIFI